ncbi:thermonuclease family protein [Helicobacter mesocricetorum]|uniref:thermonuclease family protein n=1 Tax=Helicobacter mesocricetorum TaxID=87012 RepID=UPI001F361058|nr:thermonuclease family protein [Helicobacter mesocricetorum]
MRTCFIFLMILWICGNNLYGVIAPVSLQILLKSIYAPALFSAYNKDYGMLYCQLYGVASVARGFQDEKCAVSADSAKKMRHFAMTYTRNKIFLEQQYRIGYINGWCFLQNGANLFNYEIVRDGYAIVQYFDTNAENVLKDLEILEIEARTQKKGLWREWGEEMNCLKVALMERAKEAMEKE